VGVSSGGLRLVVPARNEPGLAVAALRSLDGAGAPVVDIHVHQPTLDDVFAILTGAEGAAGTAGAPAAGAAAVAADEAAAGADEAAA
jgi:hypothetical protein